MEPTLIRVDADEVTYNLHIVLRFEMEKKLFAGELAVRDLPAAWREASRELVGLEPANDREGVLQDVHWSGGAFGYFPSYCLGNMIAAQLWYRAHALRPDLEADFARGDFSWLLEWLRENVHRQGRQPARVDSADHDVGGHLARVGGDRGDPAVADHEVAHRAVEQDGDPARREPGCGAPAANSNGKHPPRRPYSDSLRENPTMCSR